MSGWYTGSFLPLLFKVKALGRSASFYFEAWKFINLFLLKGAMIFQPGEEAKCMYHH